MVFAYSAFLLLERRMGLKRATVMEPDLSMKVDNSEQKNRAQQVNF